MVISYVCLVLRCNFVDASRFEFGSALLVKEKIRYRIGTCGSRGDYNYSNWREIKNLVCAVEEVE